MISSVRDETGRTGRQARAVETAGAAADAIGPITPGIRVFLLTRGQFSLYDMVLHVVRSIGPCDISVWTWAISEFEFEAMGGLMARREILSGRLVIDVAAEYNRRGDTLEAWRRRFGVESVRVCKNHAKIARVWNADARVLIRGSMNLNFNPRFEQADITEGGPEFDLVAEVEDALPVLRRRPSLDEADRASGVGRRFEASTLAMFDGLKTWQK